MFTLDPEDGLVAIERVQAVADLDTKSTQKNGYTTVTFLVSFEPEFEHEGRQTTCDELIGDIYAVLSESTGASCLGSLRVTLSDHCGKQGAQAAPSSPACTLFLILGILTLRDRR